MDFTFEISTLLILLGYSLFVFGVCSHSWKDEIGYNYGLWYRCDNGDCVFYSVDYLFAFLNFVRMGILVSALMLTASTLCLLIEVGMVICRHWSKHKLRLGKAVGVLAVFGGLLASGSIALYGYETIHNNQKLPALSWGFATTGLGILSLFLGVILRTMGPASTWDKIFCIRHTSPGHRGTHYNKRNPSIEDTPGHYKRKPKENQTNKGRPKKLNITHPTADIIMYQKAAQDYFNTSACSSDYPLLRQDSNPSSHHRYEELPLMRRYDNTVPSQHQDVTLYKRDIRSPRLNTLSSNRQLRIVHNPNTGTLSTQPSPRLLRDLDLAPRQSSSLPPGISPGFYNKTHGGLPQRRENKYEIEPILSNARQPRILQPRTTQTMPHGSQFTQIPTYDRFRPLHSPLSTTSNPDGQSTPRSIRLISFDTSSMQSSSSPATPSPPPPPSPPLPPPPPPLAHTTTDNDVGVFNFRGVNHPQIVNYDKSNFSVFSFDTNRY